MHYNWQFMCKKKKDISGFKRHNQPYCLGIMSLKSVKMARFMDKKVDGIHIMAMGNVYGTNELVSFIRSKTA